MSKLFIVFLLNLTFCSFIEIQCRSLTDVLQLTLNALFEFVTQHSDGKDQHIGGCLRDFRNRPHPVRVRVRYYQNVLTVRQYSLVCHLSYYSYRHSGLFHMSAMHTDLLINLKKKKFLLCARLCYRKLQNKQLLWIRRGILIKSFNYIVPISSFR